MDKVVSTRVDESVASLIDRLSQRLHISKKELIESAVRQYAEGLEEAQRVHVFRETCGAWKRKESVATTRNRAREAFEKSVRRHKR